MDLLEDISDPTDFEDASLRALDMAIRCPVCKEVVNNPVMTPCGHSFCSLVGSCCRCIALGLMCAQCIRSALCATPECPSCREKCTEGLLKRNTMLAEVVQAYNSARCEGIIPPEGVKLLRG
jgi:E3 ubiquitin-protein ligase RAD18